MKNKYSPSKLLLLLMILAIISFFGVEYYRLRHINSQTEQYSQSEPNRYQSEQSSGSTNEITTTGVPTQQNTPLPEKVYLDVPFQVQAPGGNWDAIHEEACEEASLLMVYHYIKNTPIKDPNSELNNILDFEASHGFGFDVTTTELSAIAKSLFGLNTGVVKKNISIDDIKKELADGKPVIVPAAGKMLPNPNFRNGGPNYHMLVIKGYDSNGFITNDPGTRLGKDFRYSFNDLYNAIHDYASPNILNGEKNYLVFN